MKKKKIVIAVIICILLGTYCTRVYYVNAEIKTVSKLIYSKNEVVPFENDYTDSPEGACSGYTVQCLSNEALSVSEFCEKYKIKESNLGDVPDYYYLVEVSIENTNTVTTEEYGINLNYFSLVGPNYFCLVDDYTFQLLNPDMPGISFALNAQTSKTVILPYVGHNSTDGDINSMLNHKPKLQITEFPNRKMIDLGKEN